MSEPFVCCDRQIHKRNPDGVSGDGGYGRTVVDFHVRQRLPHQRRLQRHVLEHLWHHRQVRLINNHHNDDNSTENSEPP